MESVNINHALTLIVCWLMLIYGHLTQSSIVYAGAIALMAINFIVLMLSL